MFSVKSAKDFGKKFESVLEELKHLDTLKRDVMVYKNDIRVDRSGAVIIDGLGIVDFTKTGFQHFCNRFDVPSEYMNKLLNMENKETAHIEEDRMLMKMCFERGLTRFPDERGIFLRTMGQEDGTRKIRAVFSEDYKVLDHLPILNQINMVDENMKATHFNISDDFLDLRFILPDKQRSIGKLPSREVKFGNDQDIIFPGIHLRNSETGKARIEASQIIYRLVCTNGLSQQRNSFKIVNKKHVGEFDITDINYNIEKVLTGTGKFFDSYTDALIDAKTDKVDAVQEVFERVGKRTGINKSMLEVVNTNWMVEQYQGDTRFDVVNALTAGARDWESKTKDMSGRILLENVAADLLFAKSI